MTTTTTTRADIRVARVSKPLLALIGGQVCLHSCMAGVRVAAPLLLLQRGFAAWGVGLLLGLFAAAPVLVSLRAGRLADRRGYHLPLRIAVGLATSGGVLAAIATHVATGQFALLCLAATLCGVGANVGLIAIQRTAGRMARGSAEVTQLFSWLGLAPAVSNMVGPVLAGLLIDGAGYGGAFTALALLPLIALAVARAVPKEPENRRPAGPRPAAWTLFATPGFKRLIFVNWLLSSSWDLHSFLVPLIGHQRGLSASVIGFILGLFAAAVAVVRIVIPFAVRWMTSEARVLAVTLAVTAGAFIAYPFTRGAGGMSACAAVLGLALGAVQPMVMTALHRITPAERHGEAIALRSMTINASSAVMPLVYGAVGAALGAGAVFWIAAAGVATGIFPALRLQPASTMDGDR